MAADRQRRGTPELAGLLVADVDDLAAAVGDRIVVPGRDPVLVAVVRPRAADAGLRDHAAELALFAMTLIHGAGVVSPSSSTITYSPVSGSKPP